MSDKISINLSFNFSSILSLLNESIDLAHWADIDVKDINSESFNIIIKDLEENEEFLIDLKKLKKGFKNWIKSCPKSFAEFQTENYIKNDHFIQILCYGEVVYG